MPVVNKADDAPMDAFVSGDDWAVVNKASGYHSLAVCLSRSVRTPQLHIALKQAILLRTAPEEAATATAID